MQRTIRSVADNLARHRTPQDQAILFEQLPDKVLNALAVVLPRRNAARLAQTSKRVHAVVQPRMKSRKAAREGRKKLRRSVAKIQSLRTEAYFCRHQMKPPHHGEFRNENSRYIKGNKDGGDRFWQDTDLHRPYITTAKKKLGNNHNDDAINDIAMQLYLENQARHRALNAKDPGYQAMYEAAKRRQKVHGAGQRGSPPDVKKFSITHYGIEDPYLHKALGFPNKKKKT